MVYTLRVRGGTDETADDAAAETDQGRIDKAREFVATLDGVDSATITTSSQGVTDLTEQAPASADAPADEPEQDSADETEPDTANEEQV